MRHIAFVLLVFGLASAGIILQNEPDQKLNRKVVMNSLFEFAKSPKTRSASCLMCTLLVDGVQLMIKQNKTDEELIGFVKTICNKLDVEQPYVCNKIIDMFAPDIIYMLQRVVVTPEEICGAFVADCGHSENPLAVMWNMTIPGNKPPVKPWPTVQDGNPTMRVLHLSDIHVDRWYTPGAEADCTDGSGLDAFGTYALCCRNYPPSKSQRQVRAIKSPAGKWGAPWRCDLPFETFVSAMKHISQTEKLDYILITGDFEAHDMWDYTKERTLINLHNITTVIQKHFPKIPIYQAIGNHEGVPMDAMPPHTLPDYDAHSPEWLYNSLAQHWKPYLNEQAVFDTKYRASYAMYIKTGLKLISINTVYCSEFNFLIYIDQVDPDGTLQWVVEQLLDSESKGEKVHLISHIPSGAGYCLKGWAFNYYQIVNRFENTIAAQFYGHTHNDHFQVFYENADPNGRPTHVNWIAPSLTTYDYNNPSYRIYTIDGDHPGSTYTVIDAETYWANVTDANVNNKEPEWKLEYNTREAYKMKDLSPASWHDLINRLDSDQSLFEKFHFYYYRNHYNEWCRLDPDCVKEFTCALRTARAHDEAHFCPKN